jgi:hypothetical protein
MAYKNREDALKYYREYNALEKRKKQSKIYYDENRLTILAKKAEKKLTMSSEAKAKRKEYMDTYNKKRRSQQIEYSRSYYSTNKVDLLEQKRIYGIQNRDNIRTKARLYYEKTKDLQLLYKRKYRQENKDKVNALAKAYKANKLNRLPKWISDVDRWMIQEAYQLARLRTKLFGFTWHVDHIIPLQGALVSGLHVPTNLQVIPGIANIRKKNRYEVI